MMTAACRPARPQASVTATSAFSDRLPRMRFLIGALFLFLFTACHEPATSCDSCCSKPPPCVPDLGVCSVPSADLGAGDMATAPPADLSLLCSTCTSDADCVPTLCFRAGTCQMGRCVFPPDDLGLRPDMCIACDPVINPCPALGMRCNAGLGCCEPKTVQARSAPPVALAHESPKAQPIRKPKIRRP